MDVKVIRKWRKEGYTIGQLYIDDVYLCDTLEDVDRGLRKEDSLAHILDVKVPGRTAIPLGRYALRMSYSPKFGKDMPEVVDVPGFVGIRIHTGNTAGDTDGCLLLGKNRAKGCVLDSRYWFGKFMDKLLLAINSGEDVSIEYVL